MTSRELPLGLRQRDGEPAFQDPWNAQVLAMADLLIGSGKITRAAWSEALGTEHSAALESGRPDDLRTYFESALAALERLVITSGSISTPELDARRRAWEQAYLETPHGRPVELSATRDG